MSDLVKAVQWKMNEPPVKEGREWARIALEREDTGSGLRSGNFDLQNVLLGRQKNSTSRDVP